MSNCVKKKKLKTDLAQCSNSFLISGEVRVTEHEVHRSGVCGDDAGGGVDLVLGVQADLVVGLQQAEDRAAQEDHQPHCSEHNMLHVPHHVELLTPEFVVLQNYPQINTWNLKPVKILLPLKLRETSRQANNSASSILLAKLLQFPSLCFNPVL